MLFPEALRYSRQMSLPELGVEGQAKLRSASVVVAGVGGLGTVASIYLVRAGVGHLTLIDRDVVEPSNLNRQVLYEEADVGKTKVEIATKRLSALNKNVKIVSADMDILGPGLEEVIDSSTLVVDGTDSYEARMALNGACVAAGVPFIHGGVWGLNGQATTILPGKTPCFACLYPQRPRVLPSPVLGPTPGIVGAIQAMEAIKVLTGIGKPLAGKMLVFSGYTMDFALRELRRRNTACAACGGTREGPCGSS